MNAFTYHDRRFDLTYTVYHTDDGEFEGALGYVGRIGADPIVYDNLSDLPSGPRHEIESRLCQLSHPTRKS